MITPIQVTLGKPETLLAADRLGLAYFPDMPTVALEMTPSRVRLLVVAGVSSYLVEGTDVRHLTRTRKVLSPGSPGAYDNGYAGLASVFSVPKGSLYALYHAEDHEGMPPIPGGIPGFYASVAAATSGDGGRSWHKIGPVVMSVRPKAWTAFPGQADRGAGEPCLAADRTGTFLYAYYTDHSRIAGRGVQICLARAALPGRVPVAGGWRKYYSGGFSEPGLGGSDTPVVSALSLNGADAIMPSVHFSKGLDCYVMVFNVNCWKEHPGPKGPTLSGVYVAYSDDGIRWGKPQRLIADDATARVGRPVTWHPSIVWDRGSTRDGWLLYGHSEHWGHRHDGSGVPHCLMGRRITFRRKDDMVPTRRTQEHL